MIPRKTPTLPFISPGHVFMSSEPQRLWAVAGSSMVVTLFDRRRKIGGMTHYCRPYREPDKPSTAIYAAPAIISLVKMFLNNGSKKENLEAQLYGGSYHFLYQNSLRPNFQGRNEITKIHENNSKIGFELLETQDIPIVGMDVGGPRGRKVGFNTFTGETVIVKVDIIRGPDWYPLLNEDNSETEERPEKENYSRPQEEKTSRKELQIFVAQS